MYSEPRASQMAAYFLLQRGGRMSYLKLIKLLYLTEREYLRLYGITITGDKMVSMPHGPVLSQTYDIIGSGSQSEGGWNYWVKDEDNYEVSLTRDFERDDLEEINDAAIEVMEGIFREFGHMSRWEIRDYTHDHCAEYDDPEGSSIPIKLRDLFIAVGKTNQQAEQLESRYDTFQELGNFTKSL